MTDYVKSQAYSSNITREQFATISGDSEGVKKTTRPRKVDFYEIFCAILYLLKKAVHGAILQGIFLHGAMCASYYYEIWTTKGADGFSVLDYARARPIA